MRASSMILSSCLLSYPPLLPPPSRRLALQSTRGVTTPLHASQTTLPAYAGPYGGRYHPPGLHSPVWSSLPTAHPAPPMYFYPPPATRSFPFTTAGPPPPLQVHPIQDDSSLLEYTITFANYVLKRSDDLKKVEESTNAVLEELIITRRQLQESKDETMQLKQLTGQANRLR